MVNSRMTNELLCEAMLTVGRLDWVHCDLSKGHEGNHKHSVSWDEKEAVYFDIGKLGVHDNDI